MKDTKTKNSKTGISKIASKVKSEDKKKLENAKSLEVETKEQEEDEDIKEIRKISYVIGNEILVDMIYNPITLETRFAVCREGQVSIEEEVILNSNTILLPLSPNYGLIANNFLLFPSMTGEYKSNAELFNEVKKFIDKYVQLPEKFLSVLSVYVMMTWVYDKFNSLSYLRAVGLFGTGKTRMLEVAGHLCYKAMFAGGSITTAALFRTLDQFSGTLLFDEADLNDMESREMLRILRQGHIAGFPVVKMETGKDDQFYPRSFKVFGPKIMASKEKSSDVALESRFLTQFLPPLEKNTRPIELSSEFKQEALMLRNKLLMFRFKNYWKIVADEKVIEDIRLPRLKQSGLAIATIANLVGGSSLNDVIEFLKEYEIELNLEQSDSLGNDILGCILDLLSDDVIRKREKIRIGADLTEAFNKRFYDDYSNRVTKKYQAQDSVLSNKGYRVSPKKMGVQVRKLGIKFERDGGGFYIPIYSEYPKIRLLAKRYRFDTLMKITEKLDDLPFSEEALARMKMREESEKRIKENAKKSFQDDINESEDVKGDEGEDYFA